MSGRRIAIDLHGAAGAAAVQHADDLQRDRAVQRPAAAHRLLAALRSAACCRSWARSSATRSPRRRGRRRPSPTSPQFDLLGDYFRYVAAMPGPEDRRRPGPRRPARAGCPVRRGHGDDPPEARLRRPHHQRLPARPGRGPAPWGSSSSASIRASATPTSGWSISVRPSMIGGVEIHCGDLIHADKHGVCLIPHEVAHRLAAACAEVERRERPLLEYCRRTSSRWKNTSSSGGRRTPRSSNEDQTRPCAGGGGRRRRRPPRTAGCGRSPRRGGSRRAVCPRRTTGPCGTRRGPWRAGGIGSSRRTDRARSGRTPGPAGAGSAGRAPRAPRRATGPTPTAGPRTGRRGTGPR